MIRRNDESAEPEKSATRIVLKENPNAPAHYRPASPSSNHGRPTVVLQEAEWAAITLRDAIAPAIMLRKAEQLRHDVRGESPAGREDRQLRAGGVSRTEEK